MTPLIKILVWWRFHCILNYYYFVRALRFYWCNALIVNIIIIITIIVIIIITAIIINKRIKIIIIIIIITNSTCIAMIFWRTNARVTSSLVVTDTRATIPTSIDQTWIWGNSEISRENMWWEDNHPTEYVTGISRSKYSCICIIDNKLINCGFDLALYYNAKSNPHLISLLSVKITL